MNSLPLRDGSSKLDCCIRLDELRVAAHALLQSQVTPAVKRLPYPASE